MASNVRESGESRRLRKITIETKMLQLFSAAVPTLAHILDRQELSTEERFELVYGLNMVHKINGGARGPGWPRILLVDFMHKEIPCYRDQVTLLRALGIETASRFFKLSLEVTETAFQERGVRFPVIFSVLHRGFNRKEESLSAKVILSRQYAGFPLTPGSEKETRSRA